MKELSYNIADGGKEGVLKRAGALDKVLGPAGEIIEKSIDVDQFVKEVEAEALKNGDSPELARKKGIDAASKYTAYLLGVGGAAVLAGRASGYGPIIAGTTGTVAGTYAVKPLIKKHVLGKSGADYDSEVEEEPLHGGD
ncbi:hypothetical protein [Anaeroselena agilis]|uniref:Uncharacterized protein n=1 Tax=Anaeroselena agilis TaxID=3063788 RepID=A0ABU3NVJ4_9FIRM|nr:hypothetical protein [Selenomonadales bacterium 4137-cl]